MTTNAAVVYRRTMAEDPSVERMAAESIVRGEGLTIEQALDALAIRRAAHELIDRVEKVLGNASGDEWLEYSDGRCRLKVGVTTRVPAGRLEALNGVLSRSAIANDVDVVKVVWSTYELEAAQERADEVLDPLWGSIPLSTGRDPSANCVVIDVSDELTAEQLQVVESAVRAARVSVRVTTGGAWATALPAIAR